MPTYEYKCPNGHDFEKFYRSISAAPGDVDCPVCGARAERRMSAGGGLLFKGSGFYITDYGKDGKKDQRKAAESSKSEGGSSKSESGSSKSESGSSGSDSGSKPPTDKPPSKGSGSSDA